RPETEFDGRGIDHDPVPHLDRPGELRQDVRPLGAVPEIDLDTLQPPAGFELVEDDSGPERRHRATLGPAALAVPLRQALPDDRPAFLEVAIGKRLEAGVDAEARLDAGQVEYLG